MSTGRDELLMAVVNHDLEHPEFDELSDIGDGQYLCSVAADLIRELRQEVNEKQEQIFELELEVRDIVNNPPHFWFGDSAEVDGNGEDHEGWLCWEHGDYEAGLPGRWALDGSSPMAKYIRNLEERVEKCVYEEDYKELESRNEQLEEELEAHQRSLDYWTEQAENADCRISRQKERIEQLEEKIAKAREARDIVVRASYKARTAGPDAGNYICPGWALDQLEAALAQSQKAEKAKGESSEAMCPTMGRPRKECGCPDCGSSLIDFPSRD